MTAFWRRPAKREGQTLLEIERGDVGLSVLLLQSLGHADEAEG